MQVILYRPTFVAGSNKLNKLCITPETSVEFSSYRIAPKARVELCLMLARLLCKLASNVIGSISIDVDKSNGMKQISKEVYENYSSFHISSRISKLTQ